MFLCSCGSPYCRSCKGGSGPGLSDEIAQSHNVMTTTSHIEGLLKKIRDLTEHNDKLMKSLIQSTSKSPHKCPVCNGTGKNKENVANPYNTPVELMPDCRACKGACVLWG